MIKKFQQGGQLQINLLLLDLIFDMLNNTPEETLKQLVQSGVTPEDISKLVTLGIQQGKIKPEIGEAILNAMKNQLQAAKHGAKLNYIKSLKHQCAEDEEVYYFKKGGSVGCGCRKKEDGGEILKAGTGTTVVGKFKEDLKKKKAEQSVKPNPYTSEAEQNFLALRDKNKLNQLIKKEKEEKEYLARNKKIFEEAEKLYNSGYADHTVGEERLKNPKKEKCGSKLKKHYNGGSLNRIPFIKMELLKKE